MLGEGLCGVDVDVDHGVDRTLPYNDIMIILSGGEDFVS